MHRTFLSLAVAALAGFATAVHADDGAVPRSTVVSPHAGQSRGHVADLLRSPHGEMIVAELHGKGEVGKPCHGSAGTLEIYTGTYKLDSGELICEGARSKIYCHPEDHSGPPKATCWDGHKQ
jgi:hypothetical protein